MKITNPQIARTTDSAALVTMTAVYSSGASRQMDVWFPKSQTSFDVASNTLEIPDWLIAAKSRELLCGSGHFANHAATSFAVGTRVFFETGMGKNIKRHFGVIVAIADRDSRDDQDIVTLRMDDGREKEIGSAQLKAE